MKKQILARQNIGRTDKYTDSSINLLYDEIKLLKRKLSPEALQIQKNMTRGFKLMLQEQLKEIKGSILYIQKASVVNQFQERVPLSRKQSMKLNLENKEEDVDKQCLIFMKDYDNFEESGIGNFEINDKYAILWNTYSVYKLRITNMQGHNPGNLEKLKFYVDPHEKHSEIKTIHVGSNPD